MEITLNNRPENIETHKTAITVKELLTIKTFTFRMIVVKINGQIVAREAYDSALIQNNDNVTVLHMVSGG